jgi:eukaryotic translation initiation factor 2C
LYRRLPNWFPDTKAGDCTIVVLGRKSEDEYAAVKRAGDITFGRHTLCLLGDKIKHDVGHPDKFSYMQHLANLALKVNLKMGGDNHHVNIHGLGSLKAKTIILGAVSKLFFPVLQLLTIHLQDVTHPGNDSTGRPSIAAVVGSIDDHFMNYPGSMRLQAGGQEVLSQLHTN